MAHKVRGGVSGLRTLYVQAFAETARVMRAGGRLVALATSRKALEEPMQRLASLWVMVETLHVNCGGGEQRSVAPMPAMRTRATSDSSRAHITVGCARAVGAGFAWILVWERTASPMPDAIVLPKKTPKVRTGVKELEKRQTGERRRNRSEESLPVAMANAGAAQVSKCAEASGGLMSTTPPPCLQQAQVPHSPAHEPSALGRVFESYRVRLTTMLLAAAMGIVAAALAVRRQAR